MIKTMKHVMSSTHKPNFIDPATGRKGRIDFSQPFENILVDAIDMCGRFLYRKRIEELFRSPAGAAQEVWDALITETYMYAYRRKATYNPKYSIVSYASFCLYHVFAYVREKYMRPRMHEIRLSPIAEELAERVITYTNDDFCRYRRNLREEFDENNAFLKISGLEDCGLSFTEFVDSAFADGLEKENITEFRKELKPETFKKVLRKEGYEGDFCWLPQ